MMMSENDKIGNKIETTTRNKHSFAVIMIQMHKTSEMIVTNQTNPFLTVHTVENNVRYMRLILKA